MNEAIFSVFLMCLLHVKGTIWMSWTDFHITAPATCFPFFDIQGLYGPMRLFNQN